MVVRLKSTMRALILATAAVLCALSASRALAVDVPVSNTAQLQAAVLSGNANDVLILAPARYAPTTTLTIARNLTIRGPASAPGATITGQQLTTGSPGTETVLNLIKVNQGVTLTLQDVNVSDNPDTSSVIDALGVLNLDGVTVATGTGPGISVKATATLNALNSTVADNGGDGISVQSTGVVSLRHTTVTNNFGAFALRAVAVSNVTIINSIIDGRSTADDCNIAADVVTDSLGNDSPATCGGGSAANLNLAPLASFGGPTLTSRLNAGSAALNAGTIAANCAAQDQRNRTRSAAPCDIGAVERDLTAPTLATRPDVSVPQTGILTPVTFTSPVLTDPDGFAGGVTCDRLSGSDFPVGTTPVSCTGVNLDGLSSNTTSFNVIVTASVPVITVPANQSHFVAGGVSGKVVTYSAPTTSNGGSGPTCTSLPTPLLVSGSTFPVGTTTITCTSSNPNGPAVPKQFTVTVTEDAAPPVVTTPGNLVRQATGPTGALVTYSAPTANDGAGSGVSGSPTCVPASGSLFALGATTVTCSASDLVGNTGSATFSVTVSDTAAPVVTVPANITVDATSVAGAVATFSVSATDTVAPASPPVTCTPASDGTFAVGTTTVSCSATDAVGNTGTGSFTVTVRPFVVAAGPPSPPPAPPASPVSPAPPAAPKKPSVGPQAAALAKKVNGSKLKKADKAALAKLLANPTCANLAKFTARAKAVSKVKKSGLTAGVAKSWISSVQSMRTTLGC